MAKAIDPKVLWGGGGSPFHVTYGKQMMWFFLISDALTFSGLLTSLGFYKHKFYDMWPISEEIFQAFPFTGTTHLPLLYVALMTFILIISSVTMVLAVEAGHRLDKPGVVKWLALTVVGGLFFVLSQVWEWSHYIHGTDLGSLRAPNGEMIQYADEEGNKYEYFSKLTALDSSKRSEMAEQTEIIRNPEDYFPREVDDAIKKYKSLLTEAGVKLRLPDRGEGAWTLMPAQEATSMMARSEPYFGASLRGSEYGTKQYSQFFFFVTGFHGFHVFSGVVINLIVLIMVINGLMHRKNHYEMVEKTGLYWHFVDLVWVFVFTVYYLI